MKTLDEETFEITVTETGDSGTLTDEYGRAWQLNNDEFKEFYKRNGGPGEFETDENAEALLKFFIPAIQKHVKDYPSEFCLPCGEGDRAQTCYADIDISKILPVRYRMRRTETGWEVTIRFQIMATLSCSGCGKGSREPTT